MPEPVVMPKREQWENFIRYCQKLQFGEITVKIQDGVPMIAEKVIERVKF